MARDFLGHRQLGSCEINCYFIFDLPVKLNVRHSLDSSKQVPSHFVRVGSKVINSVPYRLVRPEYTVSVNNSIYSIPLFRIGKNIGCTDLVSTIPANFGQYRPVQKKNFFFFLSFVIFEFLLGQNCNLLVLFVFLVCNSNF